MAAMPTESRISTEKVMVPIWAVMPEPAPSLAFVHNFIKPRDDDRLTVQTDDGTRVERFGTRASYTYQLESFARHVLHGAPLPLDTTDAVENMAVIDEIYRAAGLPVR